MKSQSESFLHKFQRAHQQKEMEYQALVETTKREEERAQNYLEDLKYEQTFRKSESSRNLQDNLVRAQQKREAFLEEQTSKFINKLCKKSETTESKWRISQYT